MAKRSPGLNLYPPGELNGSPFWYIRGTYFGVSIFRSAKTRSKQAAEKERRRIEREIEDGNYQTGPRTRPTFAEAAKLYLEACPEREVKFVERLLRYWKETPIEGIDQEAIRDCVKALYPPGPTPEPSKHNGTINRNCIAQLSAILHKASDEGLCPYIKIKRYKAPKGRERYLEPEDAQGLIDACYEISQELGAIVTFLFNTGARSGEALKLDWSDVDLHRKHVVLRDTKNGETYGVALNDMVWLAIANLHHRQGKVFPFGSYFTLRRRFLDACETAGIQDFTLHDCRHTYATWIRQAGHDLRTVMEAGRWKDLKSVQRYTHVSSRELRNVVNSLPLSAKSVNSAVQSSKS